MPRTVVLGAEEAGLIGEYAARLEGSAIALTALSSEDPELAALAGVEVAALEARSILGKGCLARVAAAAGVEGATLAEEDLDGVSRLEGVVTLASHRIGACLASMEAAGVRREYST